MPRLALSFSLVFLLTLALLGYFLRSAYVEERDLLVERVSGDIREAHTQQLVDQVRLLRGTSEDKNRDSSMNFTSKKASASWSSVSRFGLVPPNAGSQVSVRITTPETARFPASSRTVHFNEQVSSAYLDTLSDRYGVTLVEFASRADAGKAGALLIEENVRAETVFVAKAQIIGALHYRWALAGGLLYEAVFALLLMAATGFAFHSAFGSLEEHRQQLREREALIANVAHELKTPIATVGVALEAIERFGVDTYPARREEYLQLSRVELARLDRMADRAIASLEFDSLAERLQYADVDLRALTDSAWHGLALRYALPPGTMSLEAGPGEVYGDSHYLFHVLYNLLENAIKYGGEPPRVRVIVSQGPSGYSSCMVKDNGGGIPPALRERIFERFFRGPEHGHRTKGHGLGLSFVRQIIQAHGGTIAAGGSPHSGGWVCFSLPSA